MILDHIAINVKCISRSIQWYKKNFDAEVKYEDDTWALLEVGKTKIALTIPSQHPPHIAFTVENLAELPGKHNHHRDGSVSCYVDDPDGNSIEYVTTEDFTIKDKAYTNGGELFNSQFLVVKTK